MKKSFPLINYVRWTIRNLENGCVRFTVIVTPTHQEREHLFVIANLLRKSEDLWLGLRHFRDEDKEGQCPSP